MQRGKNGEEKNTISIVMRKVSTTTAHIRLTLDKLVTANND